jgi:hypothetical protein
VARRCRDLLYILLCVSNKIIIIILTILTLTVFVCSNYIHKVIMYSSIILCFELVYAGLKYYCMSYLLSLFISSIIGASNADRSTMADAARQCIFLVCCFSLVRSPDNCIIHACMAASFWIDSRQHHLRMLMVTTGRPWVSALSAAH